MKITHATKLWLGIIIFALIGQIAWVVENEFFSIFVYEVLREQASINPIEVIAWMIGASAITGTLTTLLIGALSDKIGKRKTLISIGYIVWGLSIMGFSLIDIEASVEVFGTAGAALATAIIIILADCLMTFFGTSANEVGYNAWITDISTRQNGGTIEGVLAIAPLAALIIVFSTSLVIDESDLSHYHIIYIVLGLLVVVSGILSFFLIEDSKTLKKSNESYWQNLVAGFRLSTIKKYPKVYVVLIAFFVFCLATEISLPYLLIYLHYHQNLLMSNQTVLLLFGIAFLLSAFVSVFYGKAIVRYDNQVLLFPAIATFFVGLLILSLPLFGTFFYHPIVVFIGLVLMLSGNFMVATNVGTLFREETPKAHIGTFQGIRVLGTILLPMTIGPMIGALIISNTNTFIEFGEAQMVPTPWIFLTSAAMLLFMIPPALVFLKLHKKHEVRHEPIKK